MSLGAWLVSASQIKSKSSMGQKKAGSISDAEFARLRARLVSNEGGALAAKVKHPLGGYAQRATI